MPFDMFAIANSIYACGMRKDTAAFFPSSPPLLKAEEASLTQSPIDEGGEAAAP